MYTTWESQSMGMTQQTLPWCILRSFSVFYTKFMVFVVYFSLFCPKIHQKQKKTV